MAYREKNGRFITRKDLLKVDKLGPKAYEQCAGFLRILDGKNPLDATSVHPESYEATMQLLDKLGMTMDDVKELQKKAASEKKAAPAAKPAKKKPVKKVVVRNTNTVMGKALAEALGTSGMEMEEQGNNTADHSTASATGSASLLKKVKDTKKLAEEAKRREIPFDLSVSMGGVTMEKGETFELEKCLAKADEYMYAVKEKHHAEIDGVKQA